MESWTYCDYEIAKKNVWFVNRYENCFWETSFWASENSTWWVNFKRVTRPNGKWYQDFISNTALTDKPFINMTNWFVYWRVRKILNLRVFDDDLGQRWKKSVVDKNLEVLCVSQVSKNRTHSYFEWCSMPFMYVQF